MAISDEPLTRAEQYLNRTATSGGTIPDEPLTRVEMYLNKIATGDGNVPEEPLTRMEQYLAEIAENGSGGGGWSADGIADGSEPSGDIYILSATKMIMSAFKGRKFIESAFVGGQVSSVDADSFSGCSNISKIVYLSSKATPQGFAYGCSKLSVLDISADIGGPMSFYGCTILNTIILRKQTVAALISSNSLGGTPFASGGSGGTIYIPKALYDHLGDGTSLDYKAATNWSTVDGYGTITWAQIEGSIYETQYVDGTPIT